MKKDIPALFKKRDIELDFDGIKTQNFNMCPEASKLFRNMITTVRKGNSIGEAVPTSAHDRTVAYISTKPDHVRNLQFKQYLNI